jgi:hypothetical protein
MKQKIFSWSVPAILLLLISGCGKNSSSPVGTALYQGANPGQENHRVFYASAGDTSFDVSVSTGEGYTLFTGKDEQGGVEAKTLLVFDTLTIAESIERAVLSFRAVRIPQNETAPFPSISVQFMDPGWNESSIPWSAFDEGWVRDGLNETQSLTADTTDLEFEIPVQRVQELVDPDTNAIRSGLLLTSEYGMAWLYSRESGSSLAPSLILYTPSDTVTVTLAKDAFVARVTRPPEPGMLGLSNGTAERAYLFFDTSPIPASATLSRARLILHTDPEYAFPDTSVSLSVTVHSVTAAGGTAAESEVDTISYVAGAIVADSGIVVVTSLVQNWVSGTSSNLGFVLIGLQEKSGLARRFLRDASSDSALAPRLEVYYSLPPDSRF